MALLEEIRKRASKNPKKIVLQEGNEPRVVEAAKIILKEKNCQPHIT